MNSKEYNKFASSTDISTHTLDYYLKGLIEEVGEFYGHLKRVDRDDGGKITEERFKEMIKEMGDWEWYRIRAWDKICKIAGKRFIPIEDVWQTNIDKLKDRKKRKVLHGSGSNR